MRGMRHPSIIHRSWVFALFLCASAVAAEEAQKVPVTFQLNDSMVKDKVLGGVGIGVATTATGDFVVKGQTDAAGQFKVDLAPGKYFVTYRMKAYVPIERTATEIGKQAQVITTTLSLMMEATGIGDKRRVQIVLNWGSRPEQVKDVDSHLFCPCGGKDAHVWFSEKKHTAADHSAELDVDDMDWGGPETITLLDPPPGEYTYWVHNYTGGSTALGNSEVVVRVVFGDQVAGEYRLPVGVSSRAWRPFKLLEVDKLLDPRIVPFTAQEISANAQVSPPPPQGDDQANSLGAGPPASEASPDSCSGGFPWGIVWCLVVGTLVWKGVWLVQARKRKRK